MTFDFFLVYLQFVHYFMAMDLFVSYRESNVLVIDLVLEAHMIWLSK
jgi:hypothetical protein